MTVLSIVNKTAPAQERRDVCETLEALLERAKAGELSAIGVAILTADKQAEVVVTETSDGLALAGAAMRLWRFIDGECA